MNTNKKQTEVDLIIDLPVFTEYIDPLFDADTAIDDVVESLNEALGGYMNGDKIERGDLNFDIVEYQESIAKNSAEIISQRLEAIVRTDFSLTIEEAIDEDGMRPTARLKTTFMFFEDLYEVVDSVDDEMFLELSTYNLPYHYVNEREKTLNQSVCTKQYWRDMIDDFYKDIEVNNVEDREYQEVAPRSYKKDLQYLINLALYIADEYDERGLNTDLWESGALLDIDSSFKYSFISKYPELMKYYGIENEEKWEE